MMVKLIATQAELDAENGNIAQVGRSEVWLDARADSTVHAWAGSIVHAWEGSTVHENGGEVIPTDDERATARRAEQSVFNRKVAEWIVANPDSFDMKRWDCGTTMCWAGTAVHLAGDLGKELLVIKGYAGAAGYLCGSEMVRHFYRTQETDEMRRFAEAIASGKSVAEADEVSRAEAP